MHLELSVAAGSPESTSIATRSIGAAAVTFCSFPWYLAGGPLSKAQTWQVWHLALTSFAVPRSLSVLHLLMTMVAFVETVEWKDDYPYRCRAARDCSTRCRVLTWQTWYHTSVRSVGIARWRPLTELCSSLCCRIVPVSAVRFLALRSDGLILVVGRSAVDLCLLVVALSMSLVVGRWRGWQNGWFVGLLVSPIDWLTERLATELVDWLLRRPTAELFTTELTDELLRRLIAGLTTTELTDWLLRRLTAELTTTAPRLTAERWAAVRQTAGRPLAADMPLLTLKRPLTTERLLVTDWRVMIKRLLLSGRVLTAEQLLFSGPLLATNGLLTAD